MQKKIAYHRRGVSFQNKVKNMPDNDFKESTQTEKQTKKLINYTTLHMTKL